jgi:transcriptional regulator with XRE-family HTH domain
MATETIAERLRRARGIANVGSRELDALAGLAAGHTSMIEGRKRSSIDSDTAVKLARALGVSIDWLVTGEGREPTAKTMRAASARARARKAA